MSTNSKNEQFMYERRIKSVDPSKLKKFYCDESMFYYTDETVTSEKEIIGFYQGSKTSGCLEPIIRESCYGRIIKNEYDKSH